MKCDNKCKHFTWISLGNPEYINGFMEGIEPDCELKKLEQFYENCPYYEIKEENNESI